VGERKLARIAGTAAVLLTLALASGASLSYAGQPSPDPSGVTGTLVAGGELSGTAEVDFLFNASGTYTATITVDADTLVSQTVSQGSTHLYLDTTQLLDGPHAVDIQIGDGATSTTVWSGTVDTLNAPQGGQPAITGSSVVGATLTATAGFWQPAPSTITYQWQRCGLGGVACGPIAGATASSYVLSAADTNAEVEVEVTARNANGSTSASSPPTGLVAPVGDASLADGATNGSGACAGARLSAELGDADSETVALGQPAMLHGLLACNGTPIAGATLDLELAPASGMTPTTYAQVQTAADGSFDYTVPPGPSRDITLSYSPLIGSSSPTAVATVALRVRPRITLAITPRATTNGHTIRFSGRVLGGYIGAHGLPLEIEYREGRQWMIYTEILARPRSGAFRWRYTFERTTQSITYTFRVAVPATGVAGYPYVPVASPPRSVHVNP
jgi:hypothetical protein